MDNMRKTIHQLFEDQVGRTPDRVALTGQMTGRRFTGTGDGSRGENKNKKGTVKDYQRLDEKQNYKSCMSDMSYISITYRELNKKSNQLAYWLKEKGVQPDTIVGVMVERSVKMIIAILGILKAGGAYLPIDPDYPQERIQYMLKDSNAKVLVVDNTSCDSWLSFASEALLNLSAGHHLNFPASQLPSFPASLHSSLAYILYTSGSTGRPKGVMVEHHSVINILIALFHHYPLDRDGAYLLKTPILFDVSVSELFGWFIGGGRLVILGNNDHKDPRKIIAAVEKTGITHINFVPSMFQVLVEHLNPGNIRALSSLKYVFLAGEALGVHHINKFRELAPRLTLENLYGPTEGTVYSSRYSLSAWKGEGPIPIGRPMENMQLYIFDPEGHLLEVGMSGELVIGGEGVARGYLNNPELTFKKFISKYYRSYKSYKSYISKKLYHTGDLVRCSEDGNIEFLGRMDHQVKIRGFRVELGEIEHRLLEHEYVKEAVVTVGQTPTQTGDTYLCAYIVPQKPVPGSAALQLKSHLSSTLPDYMLPSYFIFLEQMPLGLSGKIDRSALPVPRLEIKPTLSLPRDIIEEKLVKAWSLVLRLPGSHIGIDDNFFELGGNSLQVARVTAEIYKEFGLEISQSQFFKQPVISQLSQYIKKTGKSRLISLEPVEKREYYALSPAQTRFYLLQHLNPRDTTYNIPDIFILKGKPDKEKMEKTFRQLIRRHQILRTSFPLVGKDPVQRIHDTAVFEIEEIPGDTQSNTERIHRFIRPFDLSIAPLFRVGLAKVAEEEYLFLFDIHHIIGDDISLEIFITEFIMLYIREQEKQEELLPRSKLRYKDFSQWQNSLIRSGEMKRQEKYWLDVFSGSLPLLNIAGDYPRPRGQSFAGDVVRFEIEARQVARLKEYARQENTTMFMLILAVFFVFLHKLTGQEDIVVGTPTAGRKYSELFDIIGIFVNTLALRNYTQKEQTFTEFLRQIKQNTLAAFDNQDYPFENLVKHLEIKRDQGRNPLFDVLYTYRWENRNILSRPDAAERKKHSFINLEKYKWKPRQSMVDLSLIVTEQDQHNKPLVFDLVYCTSLFKTQTIEKLIMHFKEVVSDAVVNKNIRLKDIHISLQLAAAKSGVSEISFGF